MAITRENIAHFYEKYKENLKTEESVIEQFTKADTKENWVANLKKKYRSMRQLYIENEALLNLYIRPFTEGRMELNDELADEFLKQIRDASAQGYEDSLSMLELAEVLEQYFLKHGKRDNYIWTINLLGGIYNTMPDRQDGEKAAWYFQKIRSFKDCYFEIENDDVRKRIIYSFYNYAIVKINFSIIDPLNPNEIAQVVDDALDFYNDERVRSLEGDRFDFDELITELNYDVFGNYVLSNERETVDPDMLKRANKVLGDCYKEALKKNLIRLRCLMRFTVIIEDVSSFWEKSTVQSFLRATKHFVIMQLHMIQWSMKMDLRRAVCSRLLSITFQVL